MRSRPRVSGKRRVVEMCGRSACSRNRDGIRQACTYRRKNKTTNNGGTAASSSNDGHLASPVWITVNDQQYFPSYNISPQTNTPVLLSSQHAHVQRAFLCSGELQEEPTDRIIQTMKWGLIPQWHRGDPKTFPTLLNNCRYEGMFDKPSFRTAINRRQRCVVLCDGFYEWKREGKGKEKQPYFVYFKKTDLKEEDKAEPKLLTLAGLYDIWTSEQEDCHLSSLYSYTIITVNATANSFGTIHDRLPAVLENDCAIDMWLDVSIPTSQAIKCISSTGSEGLSWHPVSSLVNNSRNKSPECIVKIDTEVTKRKGTLHNWFKSSSKTPSIPNDDEPLLKKHKCESAAV